MNAPRPGEGQERAVVLGRIGAPFGLKGWVKVISYTDPPEGIAGYVDWEISSGAGSRTATVLEWKRAGRFIAVKLDGVDTPEDARCLTNSDVRVQRSALPPTAPGEHYWHDLQGLAAFTPDGVPLGQITGFLELPAHPVLVLEGERERLVPLVPERLLEVDLAAGRVMLDWHPDD
jgi:16S rRNA processing protein RimM